MPVQSRVRYVPAGNGRPAVLVHYRDGGLVAQPVDIDRGKLTGNTVPVLNKVGYVPASISAAFNVSADGRVIIAGSDDASDDQLTWFSRSGENLGVVGTRGESLQPRISPAGDRVAYTRPDPLTGNRDVWYTEFARGITARLTTHVANDWYPVWSPDSRQILFGSDRDGGKFMLPYLKTSMDPGSSESRLSALNDLPYDWSRDGRWISYGAADLRVGPASGDSPPFVFLATPALENDGRFSPDTKWIAYISNESGRSEVYVRPFAGKPATPTGKVQVSTAGGEFPVWGPSGQELFYMAGDASIFVVDTRNLGRTDGLPAPTRLFKACPETLPEGAPLTGEYFEYAFDTHDGQRFLVVCHAEPPGRGQHRHG
jgi:eukaryotic-like serine/threonine-protein kinase